MSTSVGAGLNVADIASESPNVVIHDDDFVYDESSGNCVHAQWYEEECRNCWKIPIWNGHIVR